MDDATRTTTTPTTTPSLSSGAIERRELAAATARPERVSMPTGDFVLTVGGPFTLLGAPLPPPTFTRARNVQARGLRLSPLATLALVTTSAIAAVVCTLASRSPELPAPSIAMRADDPAKAFVASAAQEGLAMPVPVPIAPVPEATTPRARRPRSTPSVASVPSLVVRAPATPPSNEAPTLEELMHRASDPGAVPVVSVPSSPALPATPTRDEVRRVMGALTPAVTACAAGTHGRVTVTVVVAGETGHVRSAVVSGDYAGTPEGSCIARAVREAELAPFSRSTFTITYPFAV